MVTIRFEVEGMAEALSLLQEIKENQMAVRDDIAAVATQLAKAHDEIVAKIEQGTVTPEDIAPLKAAAQALDDIVPDVPTEPAPEGGAEPSSPLA